MCSELELPLDFDDWFQPHLIHFLDEVPAHTMKTDLQVKVGGCFSAAEGKEMTQNPLSLERIEKIRVTCAHN